MVAVLYYGDIDIDDVTILELFFARDAVTNNVVDRRANGLGKTTVVQWGGYGVLSVDNVVVADTVQLPRRRSGLHIFYNHFKNLRCKATRSAHLVLFFICFDCHRHCLLVTGLLGLRRNFTEGHAGNCS